MDIYFVKNQDHINYLVEKSRIKEGRDVIIPLMPKEALYLYDIGFKEVKLPIQYLSKRERENVFNKSIWLSKNWYLPIKKEVIYQGVDLFDCCRLQMMGFFQDVIASDKIITRIIKKFNPGMVYFFNKPTVPSYGHPMHDGTADVTEAVFQWNCERSGIPLKIVNVLGEEKRNSLIIRILIKLKKKITISLDYLFLKLKKKNSDICPTSMMVDPHRLLITDIPDEKSLLIGVGGGYDLLLMWEYIKKLSTPMKAYPLLINYSTEAPTNMGRSGLNISDDLKFFYIGDIPVEWDTDIDIILLKQKCIAMLTPGSQLPEVLQNPLLSFQLEYMFDAFIPQAVSAIRLAATFFNTYKTVLYLDDYCAGVANRAWTAVANQMNICTINTPHSGAINLLEFFDFNSKYFFVHGELVKKNILQLFPSRTDSIIITGDPSLADLEILNNSDNTLPKRTILLLTGGFLHQAWTDMDLDGFLATWYALRDIAKERPHIHFVIKPHPSVRDLGVWYREFIKKESIQNMEVVDDRKLEDMLPDALLAILVGKPGTPGIVCAVGKIPFVYLDTMLCRSVSGYRIWNDENGVPCITDVTKLAAYIDKFLDDRDHKMALMRGNDLFFKRYLQKFNPEIIVRNIVNGSV